MQRFNRVGVFTDNVMDLCDFGEFRYSTLLTLSATAASSFQQPFFSFLLKSISFILNQFLFSFDVQVPRYYRNLGRIGRPSEAGM